MRGRRRHRKKAKMLAREEELRVYTQHQRDTLDALVQLGRAIQGDPEGIRAMREATCQVMGCTHPTDP